MATMKDRTVSSPHRPGFRPKLRYRKCTKGSLHLWNALIKPGQVVLVYPEDIPAENTKDFECLESPEMQEWASEANEEYDVPEELFQVEEKDTHGRFDVVNSITGKAINTKSLRKSEAEELRDSLNT